MRHLLFDTACRSMERSPAVDSSSTPLRDTDGSVHWLRLKQHAARLPDLSLDSVFSIRIVRVSGFLVEPIQRIQSQRASGEMSIHRLRAVESAARVLPRPQELWALATAPSALSRGTQSRQLQPSRS